MGKKMVIDLIGVPMDLGADRRGEDMGPSAIRYSGLQPGLQAMECEVNDLGNVEVLILESCSISEPKRI